MTTRQAFMLFDRFWASHVAYLAKRLAGIREGSGTMLDNTILLWGVESGTNHSHNPRDMQYLVIGGKNLGVNVGQYINNTTAQSSNKLLTVGDECARLRRDRHRHRAELRTAAGLPRLTPAGGRAALAPSVLS